MKQNLRLVLPLILGILGLIAPKAGAHYITVDGSSADWFSSVASSADLGRICRNASGQGEYAWRDASGDERTDFSNPDSGADITAVRVTGTSSGVAILIATTAAPSSNIQAQVAIDLDRVAGSGQNYLAGFADTLVDNNARRERLIQTHFASGGTAVLLDTNYSTVATLSAARGTNGFEIFVAWTNLGLASVPAAPLRFSVATFRSAATDQTLDLGGSTVANALDVVRWCRGCARAGRWKVRG